MSNVERSTKRTICRGLQSLKWVLDHYMQTTHASWNKNQSIESVCDALIKCYNEPSAYNTSELAQRIEHFIEKEGLE